jgi:hypothetical protein
MLHLSIMEIPESFFIAVHQRQCEVAASLQSYRQDNKASLKPRAGQARAASMPVMGHRSREKHRLAMCFLVP